MVNQKEIIRTVESFVSTHLEGVKFEVFNGLASNLTRLETQLLFSRCILVVGPHGGGMANMQFLDFDQVDTSLIPFFAKKNTQHPDVTVVELTNSDFTFERLAKSLDLRFYSYVSFRPLFPRIIHQFLPVEIERTAKIFQGSWEKHRD